MYALRLSVLTPAGAAYNCSYETSHGEVARSRAARFAIAEDTAFRAQSHPQGD